MWFIGLDVHTKTSSICILNHDGKKVKAQTIKGDWKKLVAELARLPENFRIVYEASLGYGTLYEALAKIPRCKDITVAHPGHLRLIFRSKKKNDAQDAKKLATLLLLDQVHAVHVPKLDVRQWRRLIELRRTNVQKRTRAKNSLRAVLRTYAVAVPRDIGGLWSKKGRAWLTAVDLPGMAGDERDLLMDELAHLEGAVKKLTGRLDVRAQQEPGVGLLQTIPGIGPRTAEAFVAYVDDPARFERIKNIGSFFGVVPCQDSSAATHRLGHITKQGPASVRQLVTEASWIGLHKSPTIRAYYDRIVGDKADRKKKALVATGHYLLRVMLSMLKTGEEWREQEGTPSYGCETPVAGPTPEPCLREEEEDLAAA